MRQLSRMHIFIMVKSKINWGVYLFFGCVMPVILRYCLNITRTEGNDVKFDLGELQIIIVLFILFCSTYFYYHQSKSKCYLQELTSGFSIKEMYLSRLLVMEGLQLVLIMLFHVLNSVLCKEMRVEHCYYYFVIMFVYAKLIFFVSCVYILVKNALVAAVINWFAFSTFQVLMITMNRALGMSTPGFFSYSILNSISTKNLYPVDFAIWILTSVLEISLAIYLVNRMHKNYEWK